MLGSLERGFGGRVRGADMHPDAFEGSSNRRL
jgi:hypothetical protein